MKGFPKIFNSIQDVLNCLPMFPEKTKAFLQNSLNGYRDWVATGSFKTEAECIKDETHDYIIQESEEGNIYIQREYMIVPGNMIDRLGFTEEEVNQILK
jgi:hypothetical protein